jgi:ribonuclease VapC
VIEPVEPDSAQLVALIASGPARVCAATLLESSIVLTRSLHAELDSLIRGSGMEVVPFDAEQAVVARAAHTTYGRGSGSKARLNLGDCFSYALAKVTGEPLLFKGEDFTHTDIEPAYVPDEK